MAVSVTVLKDNFIEALMCCQFFVLKIAWIGGNFEEEMIFIVFYTFLLLFKLIMFDFKNRYSDNELIFLNEALLLIV